MYSNFIGQGYVGWIEFKFVQDFRVIMHEARHMHFGICEHNIDIRYIVESGLRCGAVSCRASHSRSRMWPVVSKLLQVCGFQASSNLFQCFNKFINIGLCHRIGIRNLNYPLFSKNSPLVKILYILAFMVM